MAEAYHESLTEPWSCPACTYLHQGEMESSFLSCAICGSARPDQKEVAAPGAPLGPSHMPDDDAGMVAAASILAAQQAVDHALSTPALDRSAAISSLVESSLASRIAQQRGLWILNPGPLRPPHVTCTCSYGNDKTRRSVHPVGQLRSAAKMASRSMAGAPSEQMASRSMAGGATAGGRDEVWRGSGDHEIVTLVADDPEQIQHEGERTASSDVASSEADGAGLAVPPAA